jgi:hypothetical protein
VPGGVVGGAVLPAAPDDIDPGAGGDADGVRVVFAAGPGVVVDGRGPGAGVPGVAGEVADGVAELAVDGPAEADRDVLAGPAGDRGDPGQARQRLRIGEPRPAVPGLGQQMSPTAYLRVAALNAVRRDLVEGPRPRNAVSRAATDWGFWHLSRFAAQYRALFGESPRHTLSHRADRPRAAAN